MTCVPAGSLDPHIIPTYVCDCGTEVHAVPQGGFDWSWYDREGNCIVDTSPEGYRDDPKGWWERLARDNIAAYSALSCREALGMLGWTHMHRPSLKSEEGGPGVRLHEVPFCCESPMRWVPLGWQCRESGEIFPASE
jgi:hypothetical protein